MFQKFIKSINKKVQLAFLFFISTIAADEAISPATEKAMKRFEKMNFELGGYGSTIGEFLLNCSYFQDACLAYLHDAENRDEFLHGMELMDQEHSNSFKSVCKYTTSVINFYTGNSEGSKPHLAPIDYHGERMKGYLNTFKIEERLTDEQREFFFDQEISNYMRDHIAEPFILNEASISDLEPEEIYNFALLPDGTIRASKERPGDREYHVRDDDMLVEAFLYPNHTVLAGEPQQIVMTAGSFVLYTIDDKRLFFFSSKSGHFQPCYDSLRHIRARLAEIGVPPQSVVLVPDVDISSAVLKVYKIAQVPVSLNSQDSERLFLLADRRWKEVYQRIDRHMLSNLANGDFSDLDAKTSEHLTQQREEATYMRSAYHLFSSNHRHPEIFHELVKRFGKLKDAIKHRVPHRIQSEASRLLNVMDQYEEAIANYPFAPATDASSYTFLSGLVSGMEFLCSEKKLLVRDYHDLKKMARELATLFFYMAQDLKWKGKKYFIYNTASLGFFQINEMLAKAHDAYVSQVMRGQLDPAEAVYIDVSSRIVELLTRYLKHLGISPASFAIRIDEEEAKWIINSAKQIYLSHHHFLPHPKALNKSSEARDLLREIVYDREITETAVALEQLELLKKHAEVAIHILAFLDASHQRPEALQTYIHSLAQIIKAVKNNEPRAAWEEAGFMLSLCEQSFPSRALEQWQCTDQASFNETLKSCLSPLCELKEGNFISLERAKEILEQTQALRDLVNLFRKNGRMPKKEGLHPLPMACYDHLEEQADGLIEELGQAIFMESEPIWVTPQMVIHSSDILSKLF